MIVLISKERHDFSEWCKPCTKYNGEPNLKICDSCRGFVVTYHKCPSCDAINHYFGFDCPKGCDECAISFPDFEVLKESTLARVSYSLEELPL